MSRRTLSTAVLSVTAAALIGGAMGYAPLSQAAPDGGTPPPCLAEGTCALLIPKGQPRYLPLTPASSAPAAPPTSAPDSH